MVQATALLFDGLAENLMLILASKQHCRRQSQDSLNKHLQRCNTEGLLIVQAKCKCS